MKIIVYCLAGIGDSFMYTPVLKVLRTHFPNAQIDVLTLFRGTYDLYEHNPHVSRIIHWDFFKENFFRSFRFCLKLRREKYDVSINVYPQNRYHYNLVSLFVGAKKRLGHSYHNRSLRNLHFLNNCIIKEDDALHNVEENIRILKFTGIDAPDVSGYEIYFSEKNEQNALNYLKKQNLNDEMLIGLHCGSSTFKNHINKRWQPEKFAELGRLLCEKYKARILLFGGPEEYSLKENVNQLMGSNAVNVVTSTMMETAAIMKKCTIFIANDTSLMHVACSLDLFIVAIFGPTSDTYTHPWHTAGAAVHTSIQCRPCFYYSPKPLTCYLPGKPFTCINEILLEQVMKETEIFFSNSAV